MPFEGSVAHAFKSTSIRAHAPSAPGVYGISNAREWIFIGQTDNIRSALIGHLEDSDNQVRHMVPTGFVFELCPLEGQSVRFGRLVAEYLPACNPKGKGAAVGQLDSRTALGRSRL